MTDGIHYILSKRMTGRTQHAIDWVLQDINNRAIVVPHWQQKTNLINRILRQETKNGNCVAGSDRYVKLKRGDYIIAYGHQPRGARPRDIYVDNLDELLYQLFGNVKLANTTGTSELWHRESRHGSESEG